MNITSDGAMMTKSVSGISPNQIFEGIKLSNIIPVEGPCIQTYTQLRIVPNLPANQFVSQ